ncbi:MAG: radical SAM protein [Candidatus Hydrogenedentales bacterium]
MAERETRTDAAPRSGRRRAAIHTLGCRLNQSESGILAELLRREGYELVPFGEPAELGVVHTCTVTREADAKSRQLIRAFIRTNPHAYVAVLGCYAQTGYQALAAIDGIDLICGNQEKMNLLEFVRQGKNMAPLVVRDRIQRDDFTIEFAGDAPTERRANLKIQDGCNFLCSYCVIPFARGRSRSREMDNLVDEARALIARGAKELVLTGVNLGCYTWEGHTIVEVVDRLNELPGLARIRISSIEPTTVPEELLERMAEPAHALTPYLHLPLQSGSDTVLRRMKRRYTCREYVEFVKPPAAVYRTSASARISSWACRGNLTRNLRRPAPSCATRPSPTPTCSNIRSATAPHRSACPTRSSPGSPIAAAPGSVASARPNARPSTSAVSDLY